MPRSICEGLVVVETGAGSIPASLAGMILADCGARVLKVEPPEGERLRMAMPPAFLVWNRGKESVLLDLRTEGGREQVRALAASADVFIDGFGTGRAERWGLGDAVLRAANPGLVYCSVKGFGSSGAYAPLKAYDGIVAAKAGVYEIGEWSCRSGPLFTGAPFASVGAGHFAASAIVGALFARETSGRGQRVEATMVQGLVPLNYMGLMMWQAHLRPDLLDAVKNERARREGGIGAIRTAMMFCTSDGRWVQITVMLPHQAQALVRAACLDSTLEDPRYKDCPYFSNAEHAEGWENLLADAFRAMPWSAAEPRLFAESDISFEMLGTAEEGLAHPQIRHNAEVIAVEDPDVGPVRQIGPVAAFERTPALVTRSAPRLGEHGTLPAIAATRAVASPPHHPLEGVTIVEFGYFYAMPYGVTLVAQLGARVIKLEDREGDPMRSGFGPPEITGVKTMEGKESLSINLRDAAGRKIVHELVERADAFVVGFRPGIADRLGVDYATLSKINPRLVYFDAPGYGPSGPYAARPIFASEASAIAGSYHRHAGYWLDPKLSDGMSALELQLVIKPRLRGQTPGDAYSAMALCTGLLLALYHQRRTGEGQYISRTMIGSNAFGYADDFNSYAGKPPVAIPDSENYGFGALYRLYRTAAGWVFLAVTTPAEWDALTAAIGDGLGGDARFGTPDARTRNDGDLVKRLGELFATRSADEWATRLAEHGVACVKAFEASGDVGVAGASSVGMAAFTHDDPVMRETGMLVDVDHPIFGRIARHGPFAQFSDTPARIAPGCRVGQHTDQILTELGYGPDVIRMLRQSEVVFGG